MSDFDGDIVMTTNQEELIKRAPLGLPITYSKNKIPKEKIVENDLYKSDMKSFNTKIGFITNCSTTLYSMLETFDNDSDEHKEIVQRLKICRKEQGNQIDKAKGLIVKPFPLHWTKWTHIDQNLSEEEKETISFNNSIIIDKRPYFMRWLYPNYNKKYVDYKNNFDVFSIANFNIQIDDLLKFDKKDTTAEQKELISKYYKFNPLLDSDCVMNNICHHMEHQVKELKESTNSKADNKNIVLLKDSSIPFDENKFKQLYTLYKKYKNQKQNFASIKDDNGEERYKTIDQYNKSIRQEAYSISSNIRELANLAVSICYEAHPSDNKMFAWSVFGEGIVQNVSLNQQEIVTVPFLDDNGDIEHLGIKYSKMEVDSKWDL